MKFLFLLFIFPLSLAAQPVTVSPKQIVGVWKGYFTTTEMRVPYELIFSEENGKITGWSFTSFSVQGEDIVSMKKLVVSIKGNVVTEDDNDVYNNFPKKQLQKIKQVNTLILEESIATSKLTGTFETSTPRSLRPAKGTVILEKVNIPDSSKLLAKMDELGLARSLSFSLSAAPIKEKELALTVVTEKPVQETTLIPLVSPKTLNVDTVATSSDDELINAAPVYILTTSSIAYKTIVPIIKNKPKPVLYIALKNLKLAVSEKPIAKSVPAPAETVTAAIVAKSAATPPVTKVKIIEPTVKTTAPTIPSKPRTEAIVAKPPVPAPVAKAKVVEPVVKPTAPPIAVAKPVPTKLPDNVAIAPDIDLKNRKIEIIDDLTITADSLTFTLYDNGTVDGDTVSIILNGKTIVSRQGLTTKPFTKTIYLTKDMGDSVQLIMYAENLGSIAPNTGLRIINFDKKRREVRFSGDLSKNAAITLRRKEQE